MINKTVQAKIYDPENDNFLTDIDVEIKLISQSNQNEKPHYEVKGIVRLTNDFQIVEISDKNLILELNPELRGFALFSIINKARWYVEFGIFLQDSVWMNLDWFANL